MIGENLSWSLPAIVSSEYFWEVEDLHRLRKLCADLAETVKVVVSLRRQDEIIESGYNQSIKAGRTDQVFNLDSMRHGYDWYQALERWAGSFGRDNLCVRVYDRLTRKSGIVADFADAIGIDATTMTQGATEADLRLHPSVLEFQRNPNKLGYRDSSLAVMVSNGLAETACFLGVDERKAILGAYRHSNSRVAREYPGREDGNLFDDLIDDRSVAHRELTSEILVAAIQEIWCQIRGNDEQDF